MAWVMRVWLDELERLPEYSYSIPTGKCAGKTWKSAWDVSELGWRICQYGFPAKDTLMICRFHVVLLQGPRRGNERLRFKTECTKEEVATWRKFP
jgi:hypothetical protein